MIESRISITEIEINTIEDCVGESCVNKKVGRENAVENINPYDKNGKKDNI